MLGSAPGRDALELKSLHPSVAYIGPLCLSLVVNIKPVTAVILGYRVLDQRLGPLQLAGVALVVCAVVQVEGVKLPRGRIQGSIN